MKMSYIPLQRGWLIEGRSNNPAGGLTTDCTKCPRNNDERGDCRAWEDLSFVARTPRIIWVVGCWRRFITGDWLNADDFLRWLVGQNGRPQNMTQEQQEGYY